MRKVGGPPGLVLAAYARGVAFRRYSPKMSGPEVSGGTNGLRGQGFLVSPGQIKLACEQVHHFRGRNVTYLVIEPARSD